MAKQTIEKLPRKAKRQKSMEETLWESALPDKYFSRLGFMPSTKIVTTSCSKIQNIKSPQLVAKLTHIPWGHNRVIISKCKNVGEALYYVEQTIENGWSRTITEHLKNIFESEELDENIVCREFRHTANDGKITT